MKKQVRMRRATKKLTSKKLSKARTLDMAIVGNIKQ